MSDKELDEMVLEADSDKDGLINYQGNNRHFLISKIFYKILASVTFLLELWLTIV